MIEFHKTSLDPFSSIDEQIIEENKFDWFGLEEKQLYMITFIAALAGGLLVGIIFICLKLCAKKTNDRSIGTKEDSFDVDILRRIDSVKDVNNP